MNNNYQFILIGLLLSFFSQDLIAQCAILETGVEGMSFRASIGSTSSRSGVAYNPNANLYYSVNAGSSNYLVDTYHADDAMLLDSVVQGFDYRGAWWNPQGNSFEGNGYDTQGIFVSILDASTSYPTGTGAAVFTSNQPDIQSVGDLDYDSNEILYYDAGFIHRYSRVDNSFLGQYALQGVPVSLDSINSNTVVYTGCAGKEIGIYDFQNQRLLMFDKVDGNYVGASQLPDTAPMEELFRMSFANNLFWLYDRNMTPALWRTYEVVDQTASVQLPKLNITINLSPNPVVDILEIGVLDYNKTLQVEIYDLKGSLLMQDAFENQTSINMKNYSTGTYIVKLLSEDGMITKKVVKHN